MGTVIDIALLKRYINTYDIEKVIWGKSPVSSLVIGEEVLWTATNSGGLEYSLIDGGYEVRCKSDYTPIGSIIIPDEFCGTPVVSIANRAFYGCTDIIEVVIPDTINIIGSEAFRDCYNLQRVAIGQESNLQNINTKAFYNCHSLTSMVLPSSLKYLGSNVFNVYGFAGLYKGNELTWKSVEKESAKDLFLNDIHYWVETIESPDLTFNMDYWRKLWQYTDEGEPKIWINAPTNNGTVFAYDMNEDGTWTVKLNEYTTFITTTCVLPQEYNGIPVTRVASYGFMKLYESVETIVIPASIKVIEPFAFTESPIKNVLFAYDTKIESIGIGAFQHCKNLKGIYVGRPDVEKEEYATDCHLPTTIRRIEPGAFAWCDRITTLRLHGNVEVIDESAFTQCNSLSDLDIGECYKLKRINRSAFWDCPIIYFNISSPIEFIDNTAFGGVNGASSSITNMYITSTDAKYYVEGMCLIQKEDKALILGCNYSEIPANVSKIVPGAFCGIKTQIILTSSIVEVERHAFASSPDVTILVEALSKPEGWDEEWCDETVTNIIWGYKQSDIITYLITEDNYHLTDEQDNLLTI